MSGFVAKYSPYKIILNQMLLHFLYVIAKILYNKNVLSELMITNNNVPFKVKHEQMSANNPLVNIKVSFLLHNLSALNNINEQDIKGNIK